MRLLHFQLLLRFETAAPQSGLRRKSMPNFALFDSLCDGRVVEMSESTLPVQPRTNTFDEVLLDRLRD